ncbi:IS30 family transposase [Anthocerotibacter panamensis]|uniref:IS30 family transposase n=1 Tax=Anthocerotibacter panamensis TaxID=2857077 RepID=UPI001C4018C2|nr:IS30 family transposase [Anthocerotibacter panamensis]
MSYTQLSVNERYQLHDLRTSQGLSLRTIAVLMKRSHATLSRELRRNTQAIGAYLPDTAHLKMKARRAGSKVPFQQISTEILEEVKMRLKNCHSPEQISGRLKREKLKGMSHETIYKMIYSNHEGLAEFAKYLRRNQPKRKKRIALKGKRGVIPNRVGIEERPVIADAKEEIGHWESDTMIGANHQGVIVTHVDKASRYLIAELAPDKTVASLNRVTKKAFKEVPQEKLKTLTSDNGKEFAGHVWLAAILHVCWYFARPYHSWERGLNEHTNGMLRQFFRKKTNFKAIKKEKLVWAVNLINHRPRKCLDYKTPHEVFFEQSGAGALQL